MTVIPVARPLHAPPASASARARILVVDDDERNLLALSEVLEPLADVVTAPSGREALRELLKEEFAVILLDVFMPEMDGYETAKLVRERPQTARIPIIFLSAVNKETEHLMRGYAMGAVDYVFKPVDPVVLKSKVAVFVDLFVLRQQIADQTRAEQELREAKLEADSERLAVERELQHSRLRQAAILEALPLALYEANFDERGRLRRRFVGGDVAKIVGEDAHGLASGQLRWCDRIVGADADALERRLADASASSVTSHYRWARKDGTAIHVIDQCVRSAETEGAWVGTLIDVTAQRELEQQLVQARKSEALGQLTGGVAHDFNNLLAAVLGGLRLLETRLQLGEREQQILEHMRHAAQSGAELVRRLMAFARKQELSPTSVEPQVLCDAVAGLVDHALGGQVTICWHIPDSGLLLYVDQAQLELALVNLLINARDAMPDGGHIDVSIERVAEPADTALAAEPREYLQIRVRDQGDGIPPELIERVTEPFFTTKAAGKGTGLGLSMVAGFVEQSGGRFRIDSAPRNGTEIAMTLPATRAEKTNGAGVKPDDHPDIRIGSILVVDDDEGVREILSEQLRDLGLRVTVAADAQHALALLERKGKAPEFVLTDFTMPGLDGMDLLATIRERWPRIKGAIMTGNPQDSLTRRVAGVPIVHKPLDLPELKRLLAEI
ncbi:MAG TPA: response regulator [Croceibacterium sp.]|nr:response regulator [Croceibacterium sp.]